MRRATSFGRWKKPAPPLWYWFRRMQWRAGALGVACAFSYDEDGYERFVAAIGPIPKDMRSPTVGRFDHDQGYVFDSAKGRWNFRWQERADNSRESAIRNDFAAVGCVKAITSPNRPSLRIVLCPHCGKEGRLIPMKRWHFDKCRAKCD